MPTKKFRPDVPGRRFMEISDFADVTKGNEPEKSLTRGIKKTGGRNNNGRITTRHRGGGHKRRYRVIDFKRNKDGVPAKVALHRVRPQPHRAHRAAALRRTARSATSSRPQKLEVGQMVVSGLTPTSSRATRFRWRTCRSVPWCTRSSCSPARARRWAAAPARRSSWSAKEGDNATLRLPQRRDAQGSRRVSRNGRRSATPSTRTSRAARPAERVGSVVARRCAASS